MSALELPLDPSHRSSAAERALARVLRLFARVEPEEVVTTGILTMTAFILMSGYYLLKTAREPLILLQWGAEAKLYAVAAQALLLLGIVRAYEAVARRVGRLKLLSIVYLFFTSNMLVFAALASIKLPIGLPFFLWVGIFSYTSIAQFWGFAADIYSEEQGKRLFAVIGAGTSIGSVVGNQRLRAPSLRGGGRRSCSRPRARSSPAQPCSHG
jgi:AAA family ATP:ADP antiporter